MSETPSLVELAGLSLGDVKILRGGGLPIGVFKMRITECEFGQKDYTDKKTNKAKTVTTINTTFEVIEVAELQDPELDPNELLERKHQEQHWVKSTEEVGYWMGMVQDMGIDPTQSVLGELMKQLVGVECYVQTRHQKDQNDPDRKYTRIAKIAPAATSEAA